MHTTDVVKRDYAETITEIRAALRRTFPGVRFSVTRERGSAWGWVNVRWTDGPTEAQVEPVVNYYESTRFDGMTDGYERQPDRLVLLDGDDLPSVVRYTCHGVSKVRSYSDTATAWALPHATPDAYGDGTRILLHTTDLRNIL